MSSILEIRRYSDTTSTTAMLEIYYVDQDGVTLSHPLVFNGATYQFLWQRQAEEIPQWVNVLKPVNDLIASFSDDEKRDWVNFFITAKKYLVEMNSSNYDALVQQIAGLFNDMVRRYKLSEKTLAFVGQQHIPFPDFSNIGQRAHDRVELTFHKEDYVGLVAVSIFCKLLCPIWAEITERTKAYVDINNEKNVLCASILYPIFQDTEQGESIFGPLYDKLEYYLKHTLNRWAPSSGHNGADTIQINLAHQGISTDRLVDIVMGEVFVRKLTIIDYYASTGSNAITYIATSATRAMESIQNRGASSNPNDSSIRTELRREPKDSGLTDENASSGLETASFISKTTADAPEVVIFITETEVARDIQRHNIDRQWFDTVLNWYMHHPVVPTPLNRSIVALYMSDRIGGSAGLAYLRAREYISCVILTQLWLIRHGFEQLAIMLSCRCPDAVKDQLGSNTDQRIMNTYMLTAEFAQCLTEFPRCTPSEKNIDRHLMEMVQFITGKQHFYNLPNEVRKLMKTDVVYEQGEEFQYNDRVMQELMTLYLFTYSPENTW